MTSIGPVSGNAASTSMVPLSNFKQRKRSKGTESYFTGAEHSQIKSQMFSGVMSKRFVSCIPTSVLFPFLETADMLNCDQVCWSWSKAANNSPSIHKRIESSYKQAFDTLSVGYGAALESQREEKSRADLGRDFRSYIGNFVSDFIENTIKNKASRHYLNGLYIFYKNNTEELFNVFDSDELLSLRLPKEMMRPIMLYNLEHNFESETPAIVYSDVDFSPSNFQFVCDLLKQVGKRQTWIVPCWSNRVSLFFDHVTIDKIPLNESQWKMLLDALGVLLGTSKVKTLSLRNNSIVKVDEIVGFCRRITVQNLIMDGNLLNSENQAILNQYRIEATRLRVSSLRITIPD